MDEINVKVVGLGGIGTYLCDPLFRYLNFKDDSVVKAHLIDGDFFENKNRNRQNFLETNTFKSRQKKVELSRFFTNIEFENVTEYLNNKNVGDYISENDYVFVCVDNHKTRNIINEHAKTLNNIIVISGGNEYYDGNVQLFIRREGKNILPSLSDYHPEILNYHDQSPEEMSCEELQNSEPQLIFSNLFASTLMVSSFYNILELGNNTNISEIYFDIKELAALPRIRKAKQN